MNVIFGLVDTHNGLKTYLATGGKHTMGTYLVRSLINNGVALGTNVQETIDAEKDNYSKVWCIIWTIL